MKKLEQGLFVGERALYNSSNLIIEDSTFENGESPLKESNNIKIYNSILNGNTLYGIATIYLLKIVLY